jgi:hypothetical protein
MTASASPEQVRAAPGLSLAACILLAGSLRPSPLTVATACSVLDLHLNARETVLGVWLRQFGAMAEAFGQRPVVKIIHGLIAPPKRDLPIATPLEVKFQEDAQQFRGPAGAVRDACQEYPPEATVVVAEASRYVSGDLTRMLADHVSRGCDITVGVNNDNTPAGLFVVRCETLSLIQPRGFTDLKEQWLRKAVEAGRSVRVYRLRDGYSYELRTREGFLRAAGAAGGITSSAACTGAVATVPTGSAGEGLPEGVSIGPRAVVVDSVVMPGARIEEDVVVARSIVCAGAKVGAGGTVIDGVVPAGQEIEG